MRIICTFPRRGQKNGSYCYHDELRYVGFFYLGKFLWGPGHQKGVIIMKWNSKIGLKGRVEIFYSPCSLRINNSTEKKHILYSWKIDFWKVNASKTLWVILKLACNLLYKDMDRVMGSWVGGICGHFLQFLSDTMCYIFSKNYPDKCLHRWWKTI